MQEVTLPQALALCCLCWLTSINQYTVISVNKPSCFDHVTGLTEPSQARPTPPCLWTKVYELCLQGTSFSVTEWGLGIDPGLSEFKPLQILKVKVPGIASMAVKAIEKRIMWIHIPLLQIYHACCLSSTCLESLRSNEFAQWRSEPTMVPSTAMRLSPATCYVSYLNIRMHK